MFSVKNFMTGSMASGAFLLAAAPALANPSAGGWVTVSQTQSAWSPTHTVDLTQSAATEVQTRVGNDAWAISKNAGTQSVWGANKATQNQKVSSDATITWQPNVWPSHATATTGGGVWQDQQAWGGQPMTLEAQAATWQGASVGGNSSQIDGTLHEKLVGAVGDASQRQDIIGGTRVDGWINPPFPSTHAGFGGRLLTNVQVFVQQLLQF